MMPFTPEDSVLIVRSACIGDFLVCIPWIHHLVHVVGIPPSRIGFLILSKHGQDAAGFTLPADYAPENRLSIPSTPGGILRNLRPLRAFASRFTRLCYLPFQTEPAATIRKKALAFKVAFGMRPVEGLRDFEGPGIRRSQCWSLFDLYGLQETPLRHLDLLGLTPEELAPVDAFLSTLPPKPWIALYPNSKLSMKIWPTDRFLALAHALRAETGCTLVLVGAKEDGSCNQAFREALPQGWAFDVAGKFSIRQSIALLARMDLVIGNDGAPLHMAALGGTPVLGLYTHKAPTGMWAPSAGNPFITLEGHAACGPCFLEHCADPKCLNAVDVPLALESARLLLSGLPVRAALQTEMSAPHGSSPCGGRP